MQEILKCNSNISKDLDPEQLKAVCAPLGNTCVFAIAGAGKTRVLTYRVANLIANGIKENNMILLTFTNKAAQEMKTRIKILLNKDKLALTAGTFHSVASMFLRKYANRINYSNDFIILDAGIQKKLINECREEYIKNYNIPDMEFPASNVLAEIYSGAINHNLTFVDYLKKYYPYIKGVKVDGIILIFQDYVKRKEETNCLDFDDLLLSFLDLLNIDDIRKEITNHFKYIFVDEYQDINWIQYEILEKLNQNDCMFVIGDSNQCIYQFRGSNDKYIDIFEKEHKNVNRYNLTYNYRSTPEILAIAESSINNNSLSEDIELHTKNPKNRYPFIFGVQEYAQQFIQIAKHIKENHMGEYEKVAILVRKGADIENVRKGLYLSGIPTKVKGNNILNVKFFKDLMTILTFISNPASEGATKQTLQIFGLYKKEINVIYDYLKKIKFDLSKYSLNLNKRTNQIMALLISLKTAKYENVGEKIEQIYNMFFMNYIELNYNNAEDVKESMKKLIIGAKSFKKIVDFIDYYELERNMESSENNSNYITIITMHKAKGLEWDYVYIPNMNKTEFPRAKERDINDNTEQVQNERKLFYVALTRAKKELVLSYSMENDEGKDIGPSVFLEELDPKCFESNFYEEE